MVFMGTYFLAVLLLTGWPRTLAASPAVSASPPCAACVALVVAAGQAPRLPPALHGLDVLVGPADAGAVAAAVIAIRGRGGRPGIMVGLQAAPNESTVVPAAGVIVLDARGAEDAGEALVFVLRTRLTELRAVAASGAQIGVALRDEAAERLLPVVAPYTEFVLTASPVAGTRTPQWRLPAGAFALSGALRPTAGDGAERWLWPADLDDPVVAADVSALAEAAPLLPAGLVPTPDVTVACGGTAVPVFLDPATLSRVALAAGCPPAAAIAVSPARPYRRVDLGPDLAAIDLPEPAPDRFADAVDVAGSRPLTVGEIVARHQAAAARQARAIRTLIASGTLTVSFEAPAFPAPITVTSRTTVFRDAAVTDLAQTDIRVNGLAFGGGQVPRLPIPEPERVSSPPLAIALTDRYRYRLDGTGAIDGVSCYVVAFTPRSGAEPLFRGRAWIAADDFGLVRIEAVQTGLRGPVVSSAQTETFTRTADGYWLPRRTDVQQFYEGAAYRTPIRRILALETHAVNAPAFLERRNQAYASAGVLLRDTPQGFRYLQRQPAEAAERARPPDRPEVPSAPGLAAVEPLPVAASRRVATFAAGVIVDPNISVPLPFAGISYVDFDLFGTGTQFSGFFGGTYGQASFSVPALGGSRWQLGGRAFAIASSYPDRAFEAGREQYGRSLRQRPAQLSIWVLRPLTPRLRVRAGYDLDYTALSATSLTATGFTVPADQVVHALRAALELHGGSWDASIWWNPARRAGWQPWGGSGDADYDPAQRDFQRYGATLARSAVLTPRLVLRGEGAVMSGRSLDRFSRYAFGTFENRLHGYPSALIRYDRGAVARGSVSWAAAPLVRLDGFADVAWVRDPGFGRGLRRYPGLGAAIEAPAPFGTLVAVEWGYGIAGVNSNGRRGTHVVRVTAYRVF
jgi:hypothetical protein